MLGVDAGQQRLVDPLEHLRPVMESKALSSDSQHAAGGGHHQRCGYALARCVPHSKSQPTLR